MFVTFRPFCFLLQENGNGESEQINLYWGMRVTLSNGVTLGVFMR